MCHLAKVTSSGSCGKTLALSILVFAIFCSASRLEHFENVFTKGLEKIFLHGIMDKGLFMGEEDLNQTADKCSKACYNCKHFCRLLVIVEQGPKNHLCLWYNGLYQIPPGQLPEGMVNRAIFRLSKPKDIEPLQKRFSYDHKIPEDQFTRNLEEAYFPTALSVPATFLYGSWKAMNSRPATAVDFDKWISSKDVSRSQRTSFELRDFTGYKIMEAVKALEQASHGNREASTEYFDTLLLTFLDIFCPLLYEGITTVYDPVKKVVFITQNYEPSDEPSDEPDVDHVLIVSYGPGDFAIVRDSELDIGNDLHVSGPNADRWRETNTPGNPVQLFEQATGKSFSSPSYKSYPKSIYDNHLSTLIEVLNGVLWPLEPWEFTDVKLPGSWHIFYRDLIMAVLSSVYENYERHPIFTHLKNTQTGKLFDDISISTLH